MKSKPLWHYHRETPLVSVTMKDIGHEHRTGTTEQNDTIYLPNSAELATGNPFPIKELHDLLPTQH